MRVQFPHTQGLIVEKIGRFVAKNRKQMGQLINVADIKALYPDEWVLLGNPIMDDSKIEVLSGIPLFHSKDKKEVCYIGRDKNSNFDKITLIYTGSFRPARKIIVFFTVLKNDL